MPVAEAIASGNAVIGYSGLGGREIFDLVAPYGIATEIQYGDLLGFVLAFNAFANNVASDPQLTNRHLDLAASRLASIYSLEEMSKSVACLLDRISSI